MMHPDTEIRPVSERIGLGVFATRTLRRGTVTWALDELDRGLAPDVLERLLGTCAAPVLRRLLYRDRDEQWVLLWDHSRFVNHSCRPNSSGGSDTSFSIALRDIEAGQEITEDYGELYGFEPFECRCGQPRCRGRIAPLDAGALRARSAMVQRALADARQVGLDQALALPPTLVGGRLRPVVATAAHRRARSRHESTLRRSE